MEFDYYEATNVKFDPYNSDNEARFGKLEKKVQVSTPARGGIDRENLFDTSLFSIKNHFDQ